MKPLIELQKCKAGLPLVQSPTAGELNEHYTGMAKLGDACEYIDVHAMSSSSSANSRTFALRPKRSEVLDLSHATCLFVDDQRFAGA